MQLAVQVSTPSKWVALSVARARIQHASHHLLPVFVLRVRFLSFLDLFVRASPVAVWIAGYPKPMMVRYASGHAKCIQATRSTVCCETRPRS